MLIVQPKKTAHIKINIEEYITEYNEEQRRMMDKMSQKESEISYSHRMGMVEHIFGHEKKNLNITQLNHRGIDKIKTEKYLHTTNYNINRYAKLKKETIEKPNNSESSLQTTLPTQPINIIEKNHYHSPQYNEPLLNTNPLYQVNELIATEQ